MSNKEIDYPFTAYPNYILDKVSPDIDASTFKVLTVIVRKTCGFHKKSDKIAYSQFEELTNLSKGTIIKAVDLLCDKQIIKKYNTGHTNSYRIICLEEENHDTDINKSISITNGANFEPLSSNTEQATVHKLNPSPVQNLNTQKKPIKENETKSSTTKEDDIEQVVEAWNSKFKISVNTENHELMRHVHNAVNKFGVKTLILAMDGRLNSPYYKEKQPGLLHHPIAFFKYPDTITNDLQRTSKNLYTYDEYIRMITEKGFHGDDFNVIEVNNGDSSVKRWELKKIASGT